MQDRAGFAAFYEGRSADVYRAVSATVGDVGLGTEAVDEAFVRAAERWAEVSAMDNPSGWVYRVAVNWATSWRRKLSLRPTRPMVELDRPHEDDLGGIEVLERLAGLTLPARQVLVLRYVLGYSVEETAAVLGVAAGTVKSRVHRARQQLRTGMEVTDDVR